MKLTLLLTIAALFQIQANTYSQNKKISLDFSNTSVETIIHEIEAISEFKFLLNRKDVDLSRKVSIKVEQQKIKSILSKLFSNTDVVYEILNKQIVLRKSKTITYPSPKLPINEPRNKPIQFQISGAITDKDGSPLPGANILEKGTSNGTQADFDGKFTIEVGDNNAILVVSYIGFGTKEISLEGQTTISVILEESAVGMDEVIVVGYGTQKKVNLTGAVDQVTSEQLETKTVANLGQALQGVVPNLNISFSDGNPTKDPSFNIRGGTSFSGGSFKSGSPLFLVDGIPMEINNLNPSDIESISVLKDAASAAIYGARAAYGVILVTTKKGSKGMKPRITYSSSYQSQQAITKPKLLNSVEYQESLMNAQILDGGVPSSDDEYKLQQVKNYFNNPDTAPSYYVSGGTNIWVANVDPWDEFLKSSAPLKTHDLSISGGTDSSSYYASLGYRDQEGLVALGDDWRKTYNAMIGFNADVSEWLNIDTKVIYTNTGTKRPHGQGGYSAYSDNYFDFLSRIGWRALMTPRFTPEDSPVGVMPTHTQLNAFINDGNITTQNSNLLMKIEGTVRLFKGLEFKTNYAYKSINENLKMHLPLVYRIEKSWTPFAEGFSTISKTFSKSDYTVFNAYFDFHKTIKDKHSFSGVLGFNQELSKYRDLTAQGNDLISDEIPSLKLATGAKTSSDNESHWGVRGAFARLNYNFDDKYLVEINSRYDGTSKFPRGNRYKVFPSISAGWRVSEENFMKGLSEGISNLKLRASFGSLGNQDVANYAYISTYGLTLEVPYLMNGMRPIGITSPGLVSPQLTWETATTVDFGMDLTLWNKLGVNFDWYKRKTSDILTTAEQLPSVLGTSVPNSNTGIMKTEGWEFSAKWNDRLKNGINYDFSFVLSDSQSEVVRFSGNPQKIVSSLYEGKKMGEIWGLKTVGIFQSDQEVDVSPSQSQIDGGVWRPGDVQYEDIDGDGKISYGESTVSNPGDKQIVGNSLPRFQYGLNTNISWKNIDFNMFWQGTAKRDYWTNSYLYWGLIRGSNIHGGIGTPEMYYDSWTPERQDAFFPAYKPAFKNMEIQSRYLLNAAFVRLKNITIGFTIPDEITKKVKIERLRLFTSGFNLLTFSKVPKFMDPENLNDAYPLTRSFTIGVQATF
ncbi:TonB-dependent receptor [Arenibacter algicola]|nr:TonB-dependent receptor [Arenibacter algicola]